MIEILLIIILLVCLNILRVVKAPTTTKKDVKEVILIQERLKDFVHQRCEIVLQEPSWMIDIAYSTIGVIQEMCIRDRFWHHHLSILTVIFLQPISVMGKNSHLCGKGKN